MDDIQKPPAKSLRTRDYLLMLLLQLLIPINLIVMFYWVFNQNTPEDRKAFSKAMLLFHLILSILMALTVVGSLYLNAALTGQL